MALITLSMNPAQLHAYADQEKYQQAQVRHFHDRVIE